MGTWIYHSSGISGIEPDASDHSTNQCMERIDRYFMRGTSCQQHCRQKLWRDLLLSGACLADICRSAGASQSRFLECGDHRCILTIGFNFLFPHKHRSHKDQDDPHARRSDYTKYQKVTEEEGDGFVECSNSFGETTKYVNMSDLKRGHFQNSFGEMKVYLDQAHMAGDSVTIEVSNSFGQLTLFIPKEWNVVQKVSVFAASVDEKRCGDSNGPICYLKGSVSFGEIEIVYV